MVSNNNAPNPVSLSLQINIACPGLGPPGIAAIVVGIILALVLTAVLLLYLRRRRIREPTRPMERVPAEAEGPHQLENNPAIRYR